MPFFFFFFFHYKIDFAFSFKMGLSAPQSAGHQLCLSMNFLSESASNVQRDSTQIGNVMPCIFVQSICCEAAAGWELQQQNRNLSAQLAAGARRRSLVTALNKGCSVGQGQLPGLDNSPFGLLVQPGFCLDHGSPLSFGAMPNVAVRPPGIPSWDGLGLCT